jgi:hypothetical protein
VQEGSGVSGETRGEGHYNMHVIGVILKRDSTLLRDLLLPCGILR